MLLLFLLHLLTASIVIVSVCVCVCAVVVVLADPLSLPRLRLAHCLSIFHSWLQYILAHCVCCLSSADFACVLSYPCLSASAVTFLSRLRFSLPTQHSAFSFHLPVQHDSRVFSAADRTLNIKSSYLQTRAEIRIHIATIT